MTDVPVPEPTETPHSSNGGLLHRLQPFLTLIIAVAAISLAVWEGVESRRHNRLTVKPRVAAEINAGRDNRAEYVNMSIESTGLGPAVINTFRVYLDGILQDTTTGPGTSVWKNVLTAFGTNDTRINAQAIGIGYYFPAGSEELLFEARRPQADTAATKLADHLPRLALQICYCSVYNTDCDEVVLTTRQVSTLSCNGPPGR
jgi:hypothetical protein